jgi:LysR family transcriptional activator of nhaA
MRVVGEFDDSALMTAFGEAGAGVFVAPTLLAAQICRQHNVRVIGEAKEVIQAFYAISVERRLTHPAIRAVSRAREHVDISNPAPSDSAGASPDGRATAAPGTTRRPRASTARRKPAERDD